MCPYRTLFTRTLESTVPAASTKSSVPALSKIHEMIYVMKIVEFSDDSPNK